jgi:Golgi phosphoprotein 3 (GPP34)
MLTLPERLLLISIDDQGKPHDPKSSLGHALAGAALTELLLAGQLRNDDRVVATTAGPTSEALLDEVVAEIRGEQRPRTIKWWVQRLASRHRGRKPVRGRLIDQLTERGLLAGGERRVLGLIPVATHRVADPAAAERARAAISEVLLGHQEPDERAAALIALVQVSGLVDACVPTPSAPRPGAEPGRSPPGTRSARPSSTSSKR